MGKTTLVKSHYIFFILALISVAILTAGNNTPPTSAAYWKALYLINSEAEVSPLSSDKLTAQLCTITAPSDISVGTDYDGIGNCSTTVSLGSPTVSNCAGFLAKAYVNSTEIDTAMAL